MLLRIDQELPPTPPIPLTATEGIAIALPRQVLDRLPLAEAALWLWSYCLSPDFLDGVFARHRGRSFEQVLTFPTFLDLIADALLQHGGKARPALLRARRDGALPTQPRAFYCKLAAVPLLLSSGLLEEATARAQDLLPPGFTAVALPASLAGLTVVVLDGKKIKEAAKRLLPVRGTPGKVYGGKLLAALVPARGLVVALAADPDGEANDCRLVPQLLPRARARIAGPRLWVADRQFCGFEQIARFAEHGDHYLIRQTKKVQFHADPARAARTGTDSHGRTVIEQWGRLGAATQPRRPYVRRITLVRPGEEEIVLVTDLLEAATYPADDLLAAYLARWGIERVFQQVTEVFALRQLIGSTPQATVFQGAFCILLYNLIQVVRAQAAAGRPAPCPVESLSSEQIFTDLQRQLIALTELVPAAAVAALFPERVGREDVTGRLGGLLARAWQPYWIKAVNQRPRPKVAPVKQSGAHTSVHKILEAYRQKRAETPAPS
jgi:Transposase DDE domain